MSKEEINNYINVLNNYNDKEYLFSTIACNAAPTLAKEKPSSLLIFNNNNHNLYDSWEQFKSKIKYSLDVKYFELKKDKETIIVLLYNEIMLKSIINQSKNINFLKKFGYNNKMTLDEILSFLSKRFENICPHEIGIFLGYPIEDVNVFINCPNQKCKITGYWKVYHNIEQAKNIFNKYDNIKNKIIRTMISGTNPIKVLYYINKINFN